MYLGDWSFKRLFHCNKTVVSPSSLLMDEKQLISKIQLLKEIKPSEDWVLSCRARLAFRLEMDRKKNLLNKDAFVLKELFAFLGNARQRPSFNWAHSFAVAAMVVVGGGTLTVWAAGQAMPGSPLYPVKLAVEKARVSASLSEESRFQLQTKLADARLQELTEVVNSNDSADKKVEKMSQVVESIQDQLATVNNRPSGADGEPKPQKAMAAAKMVSEKASQAGKTLASAKESISGDIKPDLSARLVDATKAVDDANIAALEIMIASNNNDDRSATTTKEIADKLAAEISYTEKQVSAKEQKIADRNIIADSLPIRAVLINQFEQSLDLLEKAKEALVKNDLEGALEMLKAAKAIEFGTDKMTQNAVIPEVKGAATTTEVESAD